MNKARIIIAISAAVLGLFHLALLNYNDLSWSANQDTYIRMACMGLLALSMYFSLQREKRSRQ